MNKLRRLLQALKRSKSLTLVSVSQTDGHLMRFTQCRIPYRHCAGEHGNSTPFS